MRIYFIRHGQSTFNVAFDASGVDPQIVDAPLSPRGEEQARQLGQSLAGVRFDHILTSPLTRALQTTKLAFPGRKTTVLPLIREGRFSSCDIGSLPSVLGERFPNLDFSGLPSRWWCENDDPDEAREEECSLLHRVRLFHQHIATYPGEKLAVVGHGAFLHRLTGRTLGNCEFVTWDL
jgi:broad specificity phosphatase PhoE